MPLDNKISNIIGVRLPEWVLKQLNTRSEQGSKDAKDNNNILYVGNKTSWVRLVSSVDIKTEDELEYFSKLGSDIFDVTRYKYDESGLSKQFVLYGGTSIYLNEKSYAQRAGLGKGGSYSPLGTDEIQKYGYRPMPGITNVSIETQGRLGSVRAATINFKCWDKSQLDIIDALYFRLGYSMFLEWGHTYFYPSTNITIDDKTTLTPDKVASTELLFSLDPFAENLTKEQIYLHISKNSRRSEGNYDGMLGIVTNFNFNYNQEGGYDCMIKVIGLGYLADGIKINNVTGLSKILQEKIIEYNKYIEAIKKQSTEGLPQTIDTLDKQDTLAAVEAGEGIPNYPSSIKYQLIPRRQTNLTQEQLGIYANSQIEKGNFGDVLFIRKLNGFFPSNIDKYGNNINLKLNKEKFNEIVSGVQFGDINTWKIENAYPEYEKIYQGLTPELEYKIKIYFEKFAKINYSNIDISAIENYQDIKNQLEKENLSFNNGSQTFPEITKIELASAQLTRIDLSDPLLFYTAAIKVTSGLETDEFFSQTFQLNNNLDPSSIFKPEIKKTRITAPGTALQISVWQFKVSGPLYIKRSNIKVRFKNLIDKNTSTLVDREYDANLLYSYNVAFEFNDTDLIKSFNTNITDFEQPANFLSEQKIAQQNAEELTKQQQQQAEQSTTSAQSEPSSITISALEAALRTIQLESLGSAISSNKNDLNIGNKVNKALLYTNKTFINNLFSVGVFSEFIQDLIAGNIDDSNYETEKNSKERLKINAKYGFATNLMSGKESLYESIPTNNSGLYNVPLIYRNFEPVNYKNLLTAYVIPYDVNQKLNIGTELNHPVYITLGTLLMILNHNCTLYDEKNPGVQLPLIYLDFNTEANFCLSNQQQLTTNPLKVLIPFEGSNENYRQLFSKDVLVDGKSEIKGIKNKEEESSTTQTTPLFTPRSNNPNSRDNISGNLPRFRYGIQQSSDYVAYRGKIMNVLLSIDYIADLIGTYSTKDDQNKVFLKPFIDAILTDINKYLGNFNILRLSYNDSANTLQIVDDQLIPVANQNEKQLLKSSNIEAELPLIGKKSIAKSLEIKTEISTKLSNMIAISANSQDQQSQLSTNGDYLGYLNGGLVDRYIPQRTETTSGDKTSQIDGEIRAAIQFNSAIKSFYNSSTISEDQISFATNYFIEKMTKIKGSNPATKAAAMIPVSINFSTDGISGMGMGQSFTVSKEVLPYNYNKKIGDNDKNVGFVIVGLTHTIENNQWNTAVRSNMIFIKNQKDYAPEKVEILAEESEIQKTGVTPRTTITPNANALRIELKLLGYQERVLEGEGQIANWADITKDVSDLAIRLFRAIKNSNDPDLNRLKIEVTSGNDKYHQFEVKNSLHVYGKAIDFIIISGEYTKDKFNKIEKIFNQIISRYYPGKPAKIEDEYQKRSEKATGDHIHMYIQ